MDDANAEQRLDSVPQSPTGAIIVRWILEQGTPSPGEEDLVLRGKVLDLFNHTVTPFAGLDSLLGIISRILANIPKTSGTARRSGSNG